MKLTKLLFLPISSIAVVPCVSLASCSNAMGVKNVNAELYYSDNNKLCAAGIEFILKYVDNIAEASAGGSQATINGNLAKIRYSGNITCFSKYQHLTIGANATMTNGVHYKSTIELDCYYNYVMNNSNYLTEIKNVKIVSW